MASQSFEPVISSPEKHVSNDDFDDESIIDNILSQIPFTENNNEYIVTDSIGETTIEVNSEEVYKTPKINENQNKTKETKKELKEEIKNEERKLENELKEKKEK